MTRWAIIPAFALAGVFAGGAEAVAQEPSPRGSGLRAGEAAASSGTEAGEGGPTLEEYLSALARRRLLAPETGSVERLRALVRRGEQLFLDQRYDEAAIELFEVAESPRFADFVDLEEFRGAEFMLARALERMGALRTASRYLLRIIHRGPEGIYFGPAFRKYVDVALQSGDVGAAIRRLADVIDEDDLTEDTENELRYLRGREQYDARDWAASEAQLAQVTRVSRFYASAQYLRGVIAARGNDFQAAEDRFCEVASTGDDDRFTFFVDQRYFEVKDLSRLALGRVAHETGRPDDAFYYYFQIPQDSDHTAEALFEAAYAMYEGGDYETAVDLLDQLEAGFPQSSFADEAALLRGYVHLGRCEFDEADRLFVRFAERFGPVRREVTAILHNPARQGRLYEELLDEQRRDAAGERGAGGPGAQDPQGAGRATRELLMAMLQVDPAFYRLNSDVSTLDAESGRAGRLATELAQIGARVQGQDRPAAAAALDEPYSEGDVLRRDLAAARSVLAVLTEQLDAMRGAGASPEQLAPLEEGIRGSSERLQGLQERLDEATAEVADAEVDAAAPGDGIVQLLRRDVAAARLLPARVAATRARMVAAGNGAALVAVRRLDRRLGAALRRARIGRIDAVMGSKRRVEIQIESLAAGRFPPELRDPLSIQGLLRDDEEYWPFEGELWEDEFDESDPVAETLEEDPGGQEAL